MKPGLRVVPWLLVLVAAACGSPSPTGSPATPTPTPGPAAWTTTGPLRDARIAPTLTLLKDGAVLAIGGNSDPDLLDDGVLASVERYDPAAGTWTGVADLPIFGRDEHAATLLRDGRVIVTGGRVPNGWASRSDVYDPAADAWAETGFLMDAHLGHTTTLLRDGEVLLVGGGYGAAEMFDPQSGSWRLIGHLTQLRRNHTATLLADGRVLVVGGITWEGDVLASAEVYDPGTGLWAETAPLSTARTDHTATLLADGRVLVAGGMTGRYAATPLSSVEIYDPATGTWAAVRSPGGPSPMGIARARHVAALLADGRVLVAGGWSRNAASSRCELFDPSTGAWTAGPDLPGARTNAALAVLADGRILVVGGSGPSALATATIFDAGG